MLDFACQKNAAAVQLPQDTHLEAAASRQTVQNTVAALHCPPALPLLEEQLQDFPFSTSLPPPHSLAGTSFVFEPLPDSAEVDLWLSELSGEQSHEFD